MNELHKASSPYLRQHENNPVHWRAWGTAALDQAQKTKKPILLSIGYAACHWCHVMAHESFEDEAIAQIINENFLPIKVDREERPDIDAYYMDALHDLGQPGGWPLTLFLDENANPVWGGTYFPNPARQNMPGFGDVLRVMAQFFREMPEKIAENRAALKKACDQRLQRKRQGSLSDDAPQRMAQQLAELFDRQKGGLRGAPKFPNVPMLEFLWRAGLRYDNADLQKIVCETLNALGQGGIYDHIGGGFARYAVDENWHIPHFEKMLCDNALLVGLMTEVWRETRHPLYAQRVEETINFVLREMMMQNGFAASLDADQPDRENKNQEGVFYAWHAQDIDQCLGSKADEFKQAYGITPEGNWENGISVLYLAEGFDQEKDRALLESRQILFKKRNQRARPQRDEKIIAHWNGLMIMALAQAAWVFKRKNWLEAAKTAFSFIEDKLTDRSASRQPIFSDDYAAMIMAAIMLYQATGEKNYIKIAQNWCAAFDEDYWNLENGGYFMTAHNADDVPVRLCSAHDSSCPAANSLIWRAHACLFAITGDKIHAQRAEAIAHGFGGDVVKNFPAHASWLCAHDLWHHPMQIVLVGEETDMFENALRSLCLPDVPIIRTCGEDLPPRHPAFGKKKLLQQPTAYICLGDRCGLPITDIKTFIDQIKKERKHG